MTKKSAQNPDVSSLFDSLLAARILCCDREFRSLSELILSPKLYEDNLYAIEAHGVRFVKRGPKTTLFVRGQIAAFKLLHGTRWQFLPLNSILMEHYSGAPTQILMNGVERHGVSVRVVIQDGNVVWVY